ncbi:MAG TPA: hypothetical protein VNN79_25835 [Actinomycetota bacterium]|nr:hypothetical protein [Actinomycetota bacterium]
MNRFHRDESGFALVTAVLLLAIMTLLLTVALASGNSATNFTARSARWTALLPTAESGVNDAIVRLSQNRNVPASATGCAYTGTATTGCTTPGGQYQVTWQKQSRGRILITSYGFYPNAAAWLAGNQFSQARKIQVTMGPPRTFRYALFSQTTLDVKNKSVIVGDMYSQGKMTINNDATICGNVDNATFGVDMGTNASIVKTLDGYDCDSSANVKSGGSITMLNGSVIAGDATASGPTQQDCPPTPDTLYSIQGGTVQGSATACGQVSTTTSSAHPFTKTSPPVSQSLPPFAFDPANYTDLTCYPSTGTCGEANTSSTAVQDFSTVSRTNIKGTYAVWQTNPTKDTVIDLTDLTLGGDLTVVTNAPVNLGNANNGTITGVSGSNLVIISTYIPPTGTTCTNNGGDCSIYGKNSIVVDAGDPTNPDDGIDILLYTPGKMGFKNQGNEADGSLYAGSMDLKNGFNIQYGDRIAALPGFGQALTRRLWVELKP